MVSDGRAHLLDAPHVSLFPGLVIFFTVVGFNCLGDGLRDALDPRGRAKASD
jgi:peptide/nickel transport system permease protein